MSVDLLLKLGQLLLQLGPTFAAEVAAIKAAGAASAADQAALDAQVEAMDTKRMASWAEERAAFPATQGP